MSSASLHAAFDVSCRVSGTWFGSSTNMPSQSGNSSIIGCVVHQLDSAIYGEPYCGGVAILMDILRTSGLDLIINDDLVSGLLLMGETPINIHTRDLIVDDIGTVVTALLGGGISAVYVFVQDRNASTQIALAALGGALVAALVQGIVLGILNSSVASLYVCVALDPAVLRVKHPDEFRKISAAWSARFGSHGQYRTHLEEGIRAYNPPAYYSGNLDKEPPPY